MSIFSSKISTISPSNSIIILKLVMSFFPVFFIFSCILFRLKFIFSLEEPEIKEAPKRSKTLLLGFYRSIVFPTLIIVSFLNFGESSKTSLLLMNLTSAE